MSRPFHLAVPAGDLTDSVHFYEKILEFASINLSKNGIIYLEINPNFIKDFNQILTNYSINHINFKDDFRGKKRLVKLIF